MRLFAFHSITWFNFLFLWTLQTETEANNPHVCEDEHEEDDIDHISSVQGFNVEEAAVINNFRCLLYTTNIFNCSWSFDKLHADTQLSVYFSICDGETAVHSFNDHSVGRAGSVFFSPPSTHEHEMYAILQFNLTLQDKWTVYTYKYSRDMLEVLSPPQNISALVKDGDLRVTWALPHSRVTSRPLCFEYQLDIDGQEQPKHVVGKQSYTEPNADPSHTYRVRIRTRLEHSCQEDPHWSDWSHAIQTEANNPHVCEDKHQEGDIDHISSVQGFNVEEAAVINNFRCLLYTTNIFNCSWSFDKLHADTQLSVYVSICDSETAVHSLNDHSVGRAGSVFFSPPSTHEHEMYAILQFNLTLQDKWTVYTYKYSRDMLEVLSPPQNISALVKDGDLRVTWALPHSRVTSRPLCFEYQLDIDSQEQPKHVVGKQSYTEPNADPSHTYRVRIRTRLEHSCQEDPHWSDWSHAITVEQQSYKLNPVVIISLSLGIPMLLLAVLLLVRYQRVSEVLFPPIPRPPSKYIYFLEKNDAFNFYPTPSAEPVEEEITHVEDTEQNPGKRLEKETV